MSAEISKDMIETASRIERANNGKFKSGNKFGKGNPLAGAAAKLRAKLLKTVTEDDIEAAVNCIRNIMETGKPSERLAAAREILDRTVGKASQTIDVIRLHPMGAEIEGE